MLFDNWADMSLHLLGWVRAVMAAGKFVLCDQCDQIGRFIGLWATF